MRKSLHIIWRLLLGFAAIAGFSAVFMLLWNALLPQIFGIAAINFLQSLGLLVFLAGLSKFIIISAFLGKRGYEHNPIREKWMKMTPEERKKFVKAHRFRRGFCRDFFCEEEPEKKD